MTWPVLVINMAANTTRMAHAAAELERLDIPFTRFEAVDGRALSVADLARVYDPVANLRRARHPMVGPEIGCYLSHIALWKHIAASDAAVVKLFSARKVQKLLGSRPLVADREIAVPYKVPNTTLGYAIRRDTAARLAACALPVSRPVDEDHKYFWELGLRIALVTPSPLAFGVQSAETGTITAARRQKTVPNNGAALRQMWRSICYRISYIGKLHWYRLVRRLR